jgi:sugar lactone lactonase YvrE
MHILPSLLSVGIGVFAALMPGSFRVSADENVIPFTSDQWQILGGGVVEHLGRPAFNGAALLQDATFSDGVIEVDVAVTGARSYPGLIFRLGAGGNCERVYLRPHRAGLYPDAIQYMPMMNNTETWQLYHGPGFTAGAILPRDEWIHLRLEVSGTQARLFMGAETKPVLEMTDLKHGVSAGRIGVQGPPDGSAFFSNFSFRPDSTLVFTPPKPPEAVAGAIIDWDLSQAIPARQVNLRDMPYPHFSVIHACTWNLIKADASGLVDIGRFLTLPDRTPSIAFARARFAAREPARLRLSFGYSDEVSLFVNGTKLFYGNSGYQSRDRSFLGAVGYYDHLYIDIEPGVNEIFLAVKETMGGWGFRCALEKPLAAPVIDHARFTKAWQTEAVFRTPESAAFDPARKCIYVSNYDNRLGNPQARTGFISRVGLDGTVLDLAWVKDLDGPCGLGVHGDTLYVVECTGNLVEIDIPGGAIRARHPVEGAKFLNDMAIDSAGTVYISDTSPPLGYTSVIYRYKDGVMETWLSGPEIDRANGLSVRGDELIIGNSGDCRLKAARLSDGRLRIITTLAKGTLDGIRSVGDDLIVSHWEGRTFLITAAGEVQEVITVIGSGVNMADFEFVPEQGLLIVPTFSGNSLIAWKLNPAPSS